MCLLGDRAHLGVYVLRQFQNVLWIGAAQIIGLVENLHAHRAVARVFHWRMFGGGCHIVLPSSWVARACLPTRCRLLSLRPALRRWNRSGQASSPPGHESLRVRASTGPSRGAWFPLLPRALRVVPAGAGYPVPPRRVLRGRTCIVL